MYNNGLLKVTQFKTPTIVVGNLSVGGTGKTPQIEYLIRILQNNYKVAVLSRGYKRKSKGFLIADKNATAKIIGDEPFQYYLKFPTIIVSVANNRVSGIQQLEQLENPPEIILLDDAFQHRKVQGGYNILLTPYNNLYVNDTLLPTGNLRESALEAKRAQVIIVTKCPNTISEEEQFKISKKLNLTLEQKVFFTSIEYDDELKGSANIALKSLANTKIVLVTGIANPNPLVAYLKSKKINLQHLKYADHYTFKNRDISKIKLLNASLKSVILTTEKDYVRIFDKLKNLHYIAIKTKFINRKNDFDKLIEKYVEQSSRNR